MSTHHVRRPSFLQSLGSNAAYTWDLRTALSKMPGTVIELFDVTGA